jgi:hypothetical protein
MVVSRNASGLYIRAKVSPVQPRSPDQIAVRAAVTYLSQYWRDTMTPTLRAAWDAYASTTPLPNNFGERKPRKGLAMFLRANTTRRRLGGALVTAAPPIGGEAAMQTIVLTATDADGVKITSSTPALVTEDIVSVCRCTAPTSCARNYFSGPFRYLLYLEPTTVYPLVLVTSDLTQIGQRWWFQLRRIGGNGMVGPTSIFHADVLA